MVFKKGETYTCKCTVRNVETKALVDPTTITCTIYKPDGNQAVTGTMTKTSLGIYTYSYTLPTNADAGVWQAEVKTINPDTTIEAIEFEVV